MMEAYIISIAKQALYLTLILTAPPVAAAMLTGLVISLIQATTQIQEQTLTFVPKLVAVMVALVLAGPWTMVQLVNFAKSLLEAFPTYVK
ncbi:MAG: flagellar biosynthesis protein FliQ [Deltaproteobacteria bacterium]|nr:flagellar biosynthesis protein FliQ [Deltaproteobacteria bacterium]MBI2500720.1 flagellar biosynthesis protein FliQ [Deltaproteobacteria bacterium]MBI4196687.1 flagellar biosynthesis protein FliQ [Deltaproteobacteria bacterium]